MFAMLIGIVVGLAISVGPLVMFDSRITSYASSLVDQMSQMIATGLEQIPRAGENPELVSVISIVVALTLPGFVAYLLTVAARAVARTRQVIAAVLGIVAIASFFYLPVGSAIAMCVISALVFGVLIAPAGFVTSTALWVFATTIAVDHVVSIWTPESPAVTDAAEAFAELSGFEAMLGWRIVATLFGLAPVLFMLGSTTRPTR